jgi:hypothetical protein
MIHINLASFMYLLACLSTRVSLHIFQLQVCLHFSSLACFVCITTGYGLVGVRVPVGPIISLVYIVQTGPEAQPASYSIVTGGCFPEVKLQGREADHSIPTSADVKKTWIYTSAPPYAFMA